MAAVVTEHRGDAKIVDSGEGWGQMRYVMTVHDAWKWLYVHDVKGRTHDFQDVPAGDELYFDYEPDDWSGEMA